MTLAGVGLSTASSTKQAAREAAERAVASLADQRADFAIVFATAEHGEAIPELLDAISGAVGTPYVAGCSAAGVLVGQDEIEDGPAIGVLNALTFRFLRPIRRVVPLVGGQLDLSPLILFVLCQLVLLLPVAWLEQAL